MSQPQGWVTARLGEILPLAYGKSLPASKRMVGGTVPVFGSNGIVGFHSEPLTRGPALVIGRKGAAGLVHFSPSPCWPIDTAYFTEGAEGIDLKFFCFLLHYLGLGSLDQSTAIPSLSRDSYSAVVVPIAPTAEQQRMVAKLEELFSDLDAAVAVLERARANLKRYRAAVLKAAVEGRLTEEWRTQHPVAEPAEKLLERILAERRRRWEEAQLAKYAGKGQTPPKGWKDKYPEPAKPDRSQLPQLPSEWCWTSIEAVGDVLLGRQRAPQFLTGRFSRPYLRVANIKDDRIDFSDLESMDFDEVHFQKYQLQPGDILVSEGQSPELVGQSAIFRGEVEGLCFQKTLHRFRGEANRVLPEFAQMVFRAHVKSGVFRRLAPITTNIAHLTLERFCAAPFPLPPLTERAEIVSAITAGMSRLSQAARVLQDSLIRCSRLRQSILKYAFEGKLVPQDPNDEAASVLLERIRAKRPITAESRSRRPRSVSD